MPASSAPFSPPDLQITEITVPTFTLASKARHPLPVGHSSHLMRITVLVSRSTEGLGDRQCTRKDHDLGAPRQSQGHTPVNEGGHWTAPGLNPREPTVLITMLPSVGWANKVTSYQWNAQL